MSRSPWHSRQHPIEGNLLAEAGGLATLEFMESKKLGEKAAEKGRGLMKPGRA